MTKYVKNYMTQIFILILSFFIFNNFIFPDEIGY